MPVLKLFYACLGLYYSAKNCMPARKYIVDKWVDILGTEYLRLPKKTLA